MIEGINHITLSVRALEESLPFYTEVLGCKLEAKWNPYTFWPQMVINLKFILQISRKGWNI